MFSPVSHLHKSQWNGTKLKFQHPHLAKCRFATEYHFHPVIQSPRLLSSAHCNLVSCLFRHPCWLSCVSSLCRSRFLQFGRRDSSFNSIVLHYLFSCENNFLSFLFQAARWLAFWIETVLWHVCDLPFFPTKLQLNEHPLRVGYSIIFVRGSIKDV